MESNPSVNPYQTPADFGPPADLTESGVSVATVEILKDTRPWVRLVGVLLFLGTGLMVLGGIGFGLFGAAAQGSPPGFAIGMMVAYVLMGILYLMPAIFLNRYASRITVLANQPSVRDLNEALSAQKSFWKYVGIMAIVVLALYAIGLVMAVFVGGLSMMRAGAVGP